MPVFFWVHDNINIQHLSIFPTHTQHKNLIKACCLELSENKSDWNFGLSMWNNLSEQFFRAIELEVRKYWIFCFWLLFILNYCSTLDACEKACNLCDLRLKPGPGEFSCYAMIPSWYYNSKTGSCEQFYYGGCNGNANRFRYVWSEKHMIDDSHPSNFSGIAGAILAMGRGGRETTLWPVKGENENI